MAQIKKLEKGDTVMVEVTITLDGMVPPGETKGEVVESKGVLCLRIRNPHRAASATVPLTQLGRRGVRIMDNLGVQEVDYELDTGQGKTAHA